MFKKGSMLETKNRLLNHLKHQETMGKATTSYFIFGTYLCTGAFCGLTKVSRHIALKVLGDFKEGTQNYIHGNYGICRVTLKTEKFIAWMKG